MKKTKELVIDFRRKKSPITPVNINGDVVEVVTEYKYLGTVIDNKLTFSSNVENVYNKCQSRLHFLRKLRSFNVDYSVMSLFYKSCIQSVLIFCIQCWYGALSLQNKCKLKKIITLASKISGCQFETIDELYKKQVTSLSCRILDDPSHFLYNCYEVLPSGRRLLVPSLKSRRSKTSFIPVSISLLNTSKR